MADYFQTVAKKYGGTSAGSGINATPVSRMNQSITHYDPQTNTHFVQAAGSNKLTPIVQTQHASQNLIQKIGAVGSQAFHIGSQVSMAGGKFVAHTIQDIGRETGSVLNSVFGAQGKYHEQGAISAASKQLDLKRDQLEKDYAAGKVSKDDFSNRMRAISSGYQDLSKRATKLASGPTGTQRGLDVVDLGATILSTGKLKLGTVIAKKELKNVATKGAVDLFDKHASLLEKAVSTVPAVRDIFKRDILATSRMLPQDTAHSFLARNAKQIATGLLIKRPILYQTNVGLAQDAYHQMLQGHYGETARDSAWLAVQALSGGPLGWAFRQGGRVASGVRKLALGKGSFIDELSKRIGDGSPAQIANFLHELKGGDEAKFKEAEKTLRIMQEVNLQMTGDDAVRAAAAVMEHYSEHGIDAAKLSVDSLLKDMTKWASADAIAQKMTKQLSIKLPTGEIANLVAVRWDSRAKYALASAIGNAGPDLQRRLEVLQEMAQRPGVGWGNNRLLLSKLEEAIQQPDAPKAIRNITTASTLAKDVPKATAKELEKLGYTLATPWMGRKTPAVAYEDTRKLLTAVTHGDTELFDQTVEPQPVLATLSYGLRKAGLTPEQNNAVAFEALARSLASELEASGANIGLTGPDKTAGGKAMLSMLQRYINKHKPSYIGNALVLGKSRQSALQDLRQMTRKEIEEALPGTSSEDAKKIVFAVRNAYTKVPLEFRGLGVKAFDYAFKVPGFKFYNRIQSALRYTYNPFFRTQELIETKTLAHMKANNLVWQQPKAELDRVGKMLDDSQIFTTGYTGEATQDLVVGRIHPNLLRTQRRDLAGLAMDIAKRRGITMEQMIQDHPDELADALKVIVQYPSKGALNSPLARTLNIAFFPMRYNLKVATLMAGEVAKLPPTIQTAFIHSIFNFSSWLKSDEGISWQADNADVIQLFNYFSIYGNVQSVLNRLHGRAASVGEIGLLGGLPFGAISQILDSEGIINLNTPYVDPKTGSQIPENIPQTTRARAATALEGLLNSMFTYPGRIIGLPGKAASLRKVTGAFIDTNGTDYMQRYRTEDLTPLQQHYIQVLTNPNVKQSDIDKLYFMPADGQAPWFTIPPVIQDTPVHQLSRVDVLNIKAANKAAKKAAKDAAKKGPRPKFNALPIPSQGGSYTPGAKNIRP